MCGDTKVGRPCTREALRASDCLAVVSQLLPSWWEEVLPLVLAEAPLPELLLEELQLALLLRSSDIAKEGIRLLRLC